MFEMLVMWEFSSVSSFWYFEVEVVGRRSADDDQINIILNFWVLQFGFLHCVVLKLLAE
jgi:hypothetical protein